MPQAYRIQINLDKELSSQLHVGKKIIHFSKHSCMISSSLLWSGDGSLDSDLVPRLEGHHSSCLNVSEHLTVAESDPVGPSLLLPVGLHIQVMQTIVVNLHVVQTTQN